MNYGAFAEEFIVAAYNEANRRDYPDINAGDILNKYNIGWKSGWVRLLIDEYASKGMMEADPTMGLDRDLVIVLTGAGFREAERLIQNGVKVSVQNEPVIDGPLTIPIPANVISSSSWTGLPTGFELSEIKRQSLVRDLEKAEHNLASLNLGQETTAQARAYIIAARVLAEAPTPPVDVVWELIGRANALAGVASLFVSILALFA